MHQNLELQIDGNIMIAMMIKIMMIHDKDSHSDTDNGVVLIMFSHD